MRKILFLTIFLELIFATTICDFLKRLNPRRRRGANLEQSLVTKPTGTFTSTELPSPPRTPIVEGSSSPKPPKSPKGFSYANPDELKRAAEDSQERRSSGRNPPLPIPSPEYYSEERRHAPIPKSSPVETPEPQPSGPRKALRKTNKPVPPDSSEREPEKPKSPKKHHAPPPPADKSPTPSPPKSPVYAQVNQEGKKPRAPHPVKPDPLPWESSETVYAEIETKPDLPPRSSSPKPLPQESSETVYAEIETKPDLPPRSSSPRLQPTRPPPPTRQSPVNTKKTPPPPPKSPPPDSSEEETADNAQPSASGSTGSGLPPFLSQPLGVLPQPTPPKPQEPPKPWWKRIFHKGPEKDVKPRPVIGEPTNFQHVTSMSNPLGIIQQYSSIGHPSDGPNPDQTRRRVADPPHNNQSDPSSNRQNKAQRQSEHSPGDEEDVKITKH